MNIRPMSGLRYVMLVAVLCGFAISTSAQSLQLTGALLNASKDAESAFSTLQRLKQAAEGAVAGGPVTDDGSDWAKVAAMYNAAAIQAADAPLPSEFETRNVIDPAAIQNCATRAASVQTADAYAAELNSALGGGKASLEVMDRRLSEIPLARHTLEYLKTVHEKLATVPVFGEQFALDWLDLETKVGPALGRLESALRNQRTRYASDVNKIDQGLQKLRSNVALLTKSYCSPIPGDWIGTGTPSSTQFGGPPYCRYQATMQNLTLRVQVRPDGSVAGASLTGTMVETTVGACASRPLGNRPHTYSGGGSTNGSNIALQLSASASNQPRCLASFNGAVSGGRLHGTLTIRRIDVGGNLVWQTTHSVQ